MCISFVARAVSAFMQYTVVDMPSEESKNESFDESVGSIAEKVRSERKVERTETQKNNLEQQREAELDAIRKELRESYGDVGGGGGSDGSDDESSGDDKKDDSIANLTPANLDGKESANYLERVPEESKKVVTDLIQSAMDGGIVAAVSKVQKKNDPYFEDVFHDSLAQFLHQRMQDQGLL